MNIVNQLTEAVKDNDIDLVILLLEQGSPINALDASGNSALHWAVRSGSLALIELLIRKGAKVNLPNQFQQTVLYNAIIAERALLLRGTTRVVRRLTITELLRAGAYADPNLELYTQRLLENYLESRVYTTIDEPFCASLLVAGVSMNGKMLSKSLSLIQNNIISTIVEWLKPLQLSKKEYCKMTPFVLRAFPQIVQWFKLLDDSKANELGVYYLKKATKDKRNEKLLNELGTRMPEEIRRLIESFFNQEALIGILVNKLMKVYSLSEKVAEYLLRDGIKHRDEYSAYSSQLFEHDWKKPCPPPVSQEFSINQITTALKQLRP